MRAQERFQVTCTRCGSVCVLRKAAAAALAGSERPKKTKMAQDRAQKQLEASVLRSGKLQGAQEKDQGLGPPWEAPGVDGVHDLGNKMIFSRERKGVGWGGQRKTFHER